MDRLDGRKPSFISSGPVHVQGAHAVLQSQFLFVPAFDVSDLISNVRLFPEAQASVIASGTSYWLSDLRPRARWVIAGRPGKSRCRAVQLIANIGYGSLPLWLSPGATRAGSTGPMSARPSTACFEMSGRGTAAI